MLFLCLHNYLYTRTNTNKHKLPHSLANKHENGQAFNHPHLLQKDLAIKQKSPAQHNSDIAALHSEAYGGAFSLLSLGVSRTFSHEYAELTA